jgi:hypothetical protein
MDTTGAENNLVASQPAQPDQLDGPSGLGGWLALVALGVIVTPFRLMFDVYNNFVPALLDGSVSAALDPSSPAFVNFLGPLLFGEAIVNVVVFVWSIYAAYMFFSKKRTFPRNYQLLLLFGFIILLLDPLVARAVMPDVEAFDRETIKDAVQSFVGCAIWIPYLAVSKRVKNTFIH